jgi:hypothetical protein
VCVCEKEITYVCLRGREREKEREEEKEREREREKHTVTTIPLNCMIRPL